MPPAIRLRAVCLFSRADRVLVSFAVDPATGERFARLIGGAIEVGERAVDAVRREIREELGAGMAHERLLGVVENIFRAGGELHHEVLFVFDGRFADDSLYARSGLVVNEAGVDGPAMWMTIETLRTGPVRLYPVEALDLIGDR